MTAPKLLVVDIETAPAQAYVWRMHDENIGLDQLIKPGRLTCWGAKWVGVGSVLWADERAGRTKMLKKLLSLLDEADAVISFNGAKFDLPKIKGEALAEGLPPLAPVTHIDLYRTIKRFGLQSGKLAFVGPHLGLGAKIDAGGFRLWRRIEEGDATAWTEMKKYNTQDVLLTESLYLKLKPYIDDHPRLMSGAKGSCNGCGSTNVQSRGVRRTKEFEIARIQCMDCGAWSSGPRRKAA